MVVTINDVAKEAGVSITTVSRVINKNYPVKQSTTERVLEAIEKLNYKPNAMARSLITKQTSMIGVVVPGITNIFFPTIVEALETVCKGKGYNISLSNTCGDYEEERNLINQMISKQVDGIIVIDPSYENLADNFYDEISKTIPTIIVNGSANGFRGNFVSYDEEIGTREAFKYLLGLGHEKIAFVRGDRSYSYDIKEMIYKEIVKKNKLGYEYIINIGSANSIEVLEHSQTQIKSLLLHENRPTAVFACNDLMALSVINGCHRLGLKVPYDISVIGFDNTFITNIIHPTLTSVDQNMKQIGNRAAIELLDIIKNGLGCRKKIIMETNLIIRESCCRVKKNNAL